MPAEPLSSAAESAAGASAAEDRARRLDSFAARALDFADVLRALERHAYTSLGLRAVRELAPLEYHEAKAALSRGREALDLARAGRTPSLAGVCDPLAALAHARKVG